MDLSFDPYYRWLAIPPEDQPPDHYRLLGVRRFESDPEVISNAADRQMLHVRSFQTGPHSVECQRLLNELSFARTCLLDPSKKAVYDRGLGHSMSLPHQPVVQPAFGASKVSTPPPFLQKPQPNVTSGAQATPLPATTPAGVVGAALPGEATASPVISVGEGSTSVSRGHRARKPSEKSVVLRVIELVAGGVGGIAIALAILRYGFGVDPLEDSVPRDSVAANSPSPRDPAPAPAASGSSQNTASSSSSSEASDAAASETIEMNSDDETPSSPVATSRTNNPTPAPTPKTNSSNKSPLNQQRPGASTNGSSTASSGNPLPGSATEPAPSVPLPNSKLPIPSDEEKRQALGQLREVVGEDLTPTASLAEHQARLQRLLTLADELRGDSSARYVALQEAYLQAGKMRLYDEAGKVVDQLASEYDVDEVTVRLRMLKDFAEVAKTPQARATLAKDALTFAEKAYLSNKFEDAAALATLADTQAGKAGDVATRSKARERIGEYRRAARSHEAAQKSQLGLQVDPNDPTANGVVGRHLVLHESDFAKGLPHLAKSDIAKLRDVAQRDLEASNPTPEECALLGDAWFELVAPDAELSPLYARARYWYQRAETNATGLLLVKVRNRLGQIDQAEAAGTFVDRSSIPSTASSPDASRPKRKPRGKVAATNAPVAVVPAGAPPSARSLPPQVLAAMNRDAPNQWRAVLRHQPSVAMVQHARLTITNTNGEVTAAKQLAPDLPSVQLINAIPLPGDFTVQLSVSFQPDAGPSGGTPIPYFGFRSLDGQRETTIHVASKAFEKSGPRDITIMRRSGVVTVLWDGQSQTVTDATNPLPGNIFFHLNDAAALTIHSCRFGM
jgi:hypothetical protein